MFLNKHKLRLCEHFDRPLDSAKIFNTKLHQRADQIYGNLESSRADLTPMMDISRGGKKGFLHFTLMLKVIHFSGDGERRATECPERYERQIPTSRSNWKNCVYSVALSNFQELQNDPGVIMANGNPHPPPPVVSTNLPGKNHQTATVDTYHTIIGHIMQLMNYWSEAKCLIKPCSAYLWRDQGLSCA